MKDPVSHLLSLVSLFLMRYTGTARKEGMPFCNVTIDSSQSVRQTTIVSVDTMTPEGIVGVGELIEIRVTFSDEVRFEFEFESI